MKCFVVLVLCVFVLAAEAYRHGIQQSHHGSHRRGPRRHGYIESTAVCIEKGGTCGTRSECKTETSFITGSCDSGDGTCCVTRTHACEKWHSGRCMSESMGCSDLDGYRTCGMYCSDGIICCVPESMATDKNWRRSSEY